MVCGLISNSHEWGELQMQIDQEQSGMEEQLEFPF
jgi:hypothetical protein